MPEPDQSQSPSVAENRDGADRGVESAPDGAAEKASTRTPKKARAAKPAEPARNPSGSTSDVDESTLEPAPRIQPARLKPKKAAPVSEPSELDTLIDAETPPPRSRSASDVEPGMDDLLEQQDEPEQDGDESSGGPSTVERAGHPSGTAERTSSTQISSGDFELSGLGSLRMALEGEEPPAEEPAEGAFQPLEDAALRIALAPNDAPTDGLSSSETLADVGDAENRIAVHPGEQPVPADTAGDFSPSSDRDDRIPMPPADPAATAGPSPVESIGSPAPSADDRMSVLPGPADDEGGSSVESYGSPTPSSDDRVPMWPDPAATAGPSPVESIGSPTPSADDRMSIDPGSSVDQAINTVESYGSPSEDPSERIQLVPLPDIPGLGGVLEEYGTPAIESTERMGLWPFAPQGKPTSVAEEYGTPSRAGTDRVELHPKPDLEAAGNVLESYGEPSTLSDERVKLEPGSSVDAGAESPLESAGEPSAAVRDRVDLLPGPDLDAAGNVLESYGTPSRNPGERTDTHPKPDLDAAGNVLESYGSPSRDPGERTDVHPKPDLEAAGNVLENYGQPSDDADQRAPVILEPDADQLASANVLESYGTPNVAAEDRIEIHEKPDYEAGNTMEPAGEPSDNAEARGPVSPEPDADTLDEARTLGLYGDPTRDRADRVELVDDRGFDPGDTLEGYGNPHRRRIQRMDLDPEPEVEPEFSTLKTIGKPFRDRAARIDLEEKPDIDPDSSTMSSAVRTSKDRTERVGRIDHDAALDEAALAASALRLSTDATDRMGYIDPFEPQSSPLPDVASRGILEAGRIAVSETDDKPRTSVPTGLEGLMPDQRLRGHDRMRLTDEEDYELPPELIGKIPVPPRVVQIVGDLAERDRVTAAGHERVLQRETVHRRMDFLYQRYELLHVHRGYYHCPFAPEEPVFKNPEPRFVAGRIPLGNGMLAQLIASIYDDHSSISEQAGILDRLDFALAEEHIGTGLDNATSAMQPVMDALVAEAEAEKGKPTVDKKGVDTNRPARRRRTAEGHFLFVSSATTRLLLHLDKGETHPLLKDAPPSRRKGELVRDLFRERVGYNRAGIWAGVRRRFTLALATSPREASYALFLIHAINVASASEQGQHDELVRRSRALRAWLDDQRDQFDDPDNPLQRSVVYALASWDRMRFIDDAGDGAPVAEAAARKFPKNYVPLWPFESEAAIRRATTWYSLVHTCRLLGIRPWEYLYDCFAALSKGTLDKPERWTPAAWARANRT